MTQEYEKQLKESWISGLSSDYIDEQYEAYLRDPSQVDSSWQQYFQGLGAGQDRSHQTVRAQFVTMRQAQASEQATGKTDSDFAVFQLIDSYRRNGHQHADNGMFSVGHNYPAFVLASLPNNQAIDLVFAGKTFTDPQALVAYLKKVYCGSIGFEYMYVNSEEEKQWLQERIESYPDFKPDNKSRINVLEDLYRSTELETYLHRKYVGQKRFSLEGGELLIGLLEGVLQKSAENGYNDAVIGMAHRGRLNVMVNILGMSTEELDRKFQGARRSDGITGDVKYHLGYSTNRVLGENPVHIALAFNPSHLEAIAPVTMGNVRARMDQSRHRGEEPSAYAIILHGDASVAGQGVVAETLNMAYTKANNIDGSIHVVVNNQIGFTTLSEDARSTRYCTDIAKLIGAPVLHVNGDDPDAALFAADLAADYKAQFKKDIFIDFVCYRKHGHNEGDEPSATQPLMYQEIHQHQGVAKLYAAKLVAEGVLSAQAQQAMLAMVQEKIKAGEKLVDTMQDGSWRQTHWAAYSNPSWRAPAKTEVAEKTLRALGNKLQTLPEGFVLQKQVKLMVDKRSEMIATGKNINWGMAEAWAYATLLEEGYGVRVHGQDACRGTFAHRHAVYHDQKTGQTFTPLRDNLSQGDRFSIYNSVLSEYSALGFEYGYSETDPRNLVIWEAQFGDFANNAQVIIDQFIASGWQKWARMCGLVMLLPHGYEGMGPEHSSARLERFLQLCAQENMQVCVPTLPAQYFHMIRRQKIRPYRRPLVVMSPKSLLRHPQAVSTLEDLSTGSFQLILPNKDNSPKAKKACTRLVLCAGKVYFDLDKMRQERGLDSVHIVRIEQLYPFPYEELSALLTDYKHLKDVYWCQEEPLNQGAWFITKHRLESALASDQSLHYTGRDKMAAPASGDKSMHDQRQHAVTLAGLGLTQ